MSAEGVAMDREQVLTTSKTPLPPKRALKFYVELGDRAGDLMVTCVTDGRWRIVRSVANAARWIQRCAEDGNPGITISVVEWRNDIVPPTQGGAP